jgi:hypothetical protein
VIESQQEFLKAYSQLPVGYENVTAIEYYPDGTVKLIERVTYGHGGGKIRIIDPPPK